MVRDRHREPGARVAFTLILSGLLLAACVQAPRDPLTDANLAPRDRALLANAPYRPVTLTPAYQSSVVQFHRKRAPGSTGCVPAAIGPISSQRSSGLDRYRYRRVISLLRRPPQQGGCPNGSRGGD